MDLKRQERFLALIRTERERQESKWGDDQAEGGGSRDAFRQKFCAILMEEVGEVARAILEGDEAHALVEMAEVAATCCRYYELNTPGTVLP